MKTNNKKRIKFPYALGVLIVSLLTLGCGSDDDDSLLGNWIDRSVFDGTPRSSSIAYTLGDKGYMGTGFDGDDYLKDFWVYDINGDFWSQLSDFPGIERSAASSFGIGSSIYVGLGFDGDFELGDFYQYNVSTNSWSQIADFIDSPRRGAVGFSSDTHGYVGTGFDGDNDKKDFFKYTPSTDSWEEISGFGGDKRRDASTFEINSEIYLAGGISNGIFARDFWKFNLASETWIRLNDLDDDDTGDGEIPRYAAAAFSIGGQGYFACGIANGVIGSVWAYDPTSDSWEEMTEFEGVARQDPIAISNGVNGYVGLGRNGTLYLDDLLEFNPFEEEDEDD